MNNQARNPYKIFLILLASCLCILILLGGHFYYKYEKKTIRKEKIEVLEAVAHLKIDQITSWRNERLAEVNVISRNSFFVENIEQILHDGSHAAIKNNFAEQLYFIKTQYGYENIIIASPERELVFSVDPELKTIDSVTRGFITKHDIKQKAIFTELYYSESHRKIHYDIFVPVTNRNDVLIAIFIFRVDPYKFLYPLIQSWPTPSKSSEISIVQKNGDSVQFLNELRHRSNTALALRFPISRTTSPSVQAVLGYEGIWEGKDYRNVPVLAYICKVPETTWYLVVKIDRREIFSEIYYRSLLITFIALSLTILSAVSIALIYYFRQKKIYWKLYVNEKDLAESREEFRTTLYSIGEAVITFTTDGRIKSMNPVGEKLTGWAESEARGRKPEEVFRLVDEATKENAENLAERVFSEGVIMGFTNHSLLISKTGRKIPVAGNGAPIRDENGNITGVVVVFADQTAKLEAEKILRDNEERFRIVAETANDLIYEWDLEQRVEWHGKIDEMLGYEPGGFPRTLDGWVTVLHPGDQSHVLDAVQAHLERHVPYAIEYRVRRKDGIYRWWAARGAVSRTPDGKPIRWIGSITDITDRRQAEEDLRKSQLLLKASIESPKDMIIFSLDRQYRYLYFNNFHKDVMVKAYKKDITLGMNMLEYMTQDDGRKAKINFDRAMAGESHITIEEYGEAERYYYETRYNPIVTEKDEVIGATAFSLNITERRRTEMALSALSKRQEAIFDALTEIIMEVDTNKVYMWANQAGLDFFGGDVIGREASFYFEGEQDTYQSVQPLFNGQQDLIFVESWQLRKDGEKRLLSWRCRALKDNNGNVIGVLSSGRDITERRKSEETLRTLHQAIDASSEIVFMTDTEGVITFINPAFTNLYGYEPEEVIGKVTPRILKSGLMEEVFYESFWKELLNGKELKGEYINKTKDGRFITIEGSANTVFSDKKKILGFLGIHRDITKRKQVEEDLLKSEKKYRDLFENDLAANFITSVDGEIQLCNPAFVNIFGFRSREEALHFNATGLYKEAKERQQLIKDLREKKKLEFVEQEFVRPDGRTVTVLLSFTGEFDKNNELVRIIGYLSDITERKKAEQEIRQLNDELEQRVMERTAQLSAINKELEAFSYTISHDLRAPLRAIDGFTKILFEENEPKLDEEGKRLCSIIRENTRRMGQLIDDLLTFSRLSRIELNISRIDMHKLAEAVYEEQTSPQQRRRIDFQLGEICSVHGDIALLRQVWANLISNAIKFSSRREQAIIRISGKQEKNMAEYCITDNGTGFDMKYMDKLFGVFQRLHSTNDFEGTGVGLAIVQHIIIRHGGMVWAEGEVNKGASFYFSLPV